MDVVLQLDDQIIPQFLHFYIFFEKLVLCYACNGLPENGVKVEHDIFGGILLSLLFLKLSFAHKFEGNRYYVADSFNQKDFDSFEDSLVELTVDECSIQIHIFLGKLLFEVELVFKNLISRVQQVFEGNSMLQLVLYVVIGYFEVGTKLGQ